MNRNPVKKCLYDIIEDIKTGLHTYKNPVDVLRDIYERQGCGEKSPKDIAEMKEDCSTLSYYLWNNMPFADNYDIISNAIHWMELKPEKAEELAELIIEGISEQNEGFFTRDGKYEEPVPLEREDKNRVKMTYHGKELEDILSENADAMMGSTMLKDPREMRPQEIYKYLDKYIYGQNEAKKAASMLLWEHARGIKSNLLFMGPTGCGKTEIFRRLKSIYPYIQIVDASAITENGWKGDYKFVDVFKSLRYPSVIEKSIIIFDEADKMFEPKSNASGQNVSYSLQNELLKMIEGEDMIINEHKIDTTGISFVFLGSFETLVESKKNRPNDMGFGGKVDHKDISYADEFGSEDLIKYAGVRREIAGRIDRIIQLDPMTKDEFYHILKNPDMSPITELTRKFEQEVDLSENDMMVLAEEAANSGLGVRYMRGKIKKMIEDDIFEHNSGSVYSVQSYRLSDLIDNCPAELE